VEANDSWELSGWSANWNFTTTSGLNNPPLLTLPSVAPMTGSTTTTFTYTVRYQDSDGDAPAANNPQLWIMKGGIPISGTPFTMIPGAWVSLPNDYVAGRNYSYATSLSVAGTDYTYYFSVADIWGASNSTIEIDAPDVTNTTPMLDWIGIGNYISDGLDPEIGTTTTIFTYRVVYRDVDNDSATNVEVRIEKPSGTPWGTLTMSLDSWIGAPNDYIAGAIYSASTTLSPSGLDYMYFFNASDGSDWATGAPTSIVDAPDVDDPPKANATVWPGTSGFRDTIFIFDAANSTDDFNVVSWLWEFGDGNTATTETATHSYTSARTFAVNLTVWDSAGQSDTATLSVTITNRLPLAQAIVAPSTMGYVTTLFVFNGSSSSDPDGSIVTYNWNFGDGNFANGIEVNHTYSSKQTFTVTLIVTDNDGGIDQTVLAIDVHNRPPVIVTTTPADTIVQLLTGIRQTFAVNADDPDGDTLTYSWTFNGQAVGIDSPFYDYQAGEQGTYTIGITVSDDIESVSHSWTVDVVTEGFPWWLLILVIILIIVVSIILYYFLIKKKKSRKEEMDQEVSQPPPPEDLTPTIEEEKRPLPPPPSS